MSADRDAGERDVAEPPEGYYLVSPSPTTKKRHRPDESGDEPEGHMLEAQQQALERARGVERDVAEAARRQAEQIDESENDG